MGHQKSCVRLPPLGVKVIIEFKICLEFVEADEADAKLFSFGSGASVAKPSPQTVDSETIYKMSHSTRGMAIIINNKNFLRSSGMDRYPRNGTDVDCSALAKVLKSLKFDVKVYNDQTKAEIRKITKEMATTNHSDYDAFIFSVLTHGEEGLIYGTDGTISIKDLTSIFKDCPTLVGKPKIFFFQACQGKFNTNFQCLGFFFCFVGGCLDGTPIPVCCLIRGEMNVWFISRVYKVI